MSHKLKILSLNVRGLRNTNKRRAILSYFEKKQKTTIFNLQEVFSRPEDEKIWTAEWGGNVFSPMAPSIRKESQCFVINPASKFQVSNVEIDPLPREVLNH